MSIEEISADGRVKVEWIYIGEGLSGDYDPTDPNDIPLMRFDAYVNTQLVPSSVIDFESSDVEDDPWAMPQDSSYCTYVREDAETDVLRAYAILIAEELSDALDSGSWKRTAEECSWVGRVNA
jgi:hypothetical protein